MLGVFSRKLRAMITLDTIHLYPIKGIAGISVTSAEVLPRGLAGDRRWLLVDTEGRFLSQREQPQLGRLQAEPIDGGWRVSAPGIAPLDLRPPEAGAERVAVTVWDDVVSAALADAASQRWFQAALALPVRAVYMDAAASRPVDPDYAEAGDEVSFADGFPLLLANAASLADLSARVGEALAMARFRPNLVVAGAPAWAEDGWRRLRIGGIELDLVKPCARCQVTTLDPGTGQVHPRQEPLRTLAGFRRSDGKVMFAVNAIARGSGRIERGQPIELLG